MVPQLDGTYNVSDDSDTDLIVTWTWQVPI